MGEEVIIGKVQKVLELTFLEFEDATDDLDDDEAADVNGNMRRVPAESINSIRWFED